MLIECTIGVFILIMCIFLSLKISQNILFSKQKRKENIMMNESLYALSEEVKYNYDFNEVKNCLKDKNIKLKYDDDFMDELMEKSSLASLEQSNESENYLRISIDDNPIDIDNKDYLILNLEVKYKNAVKTKRMVKAKWMDYVQKKGN